jgi:hypothetical protein
MGVQYMDRLRGSTTSVREPRSHRVNYSSRYLIVLEGLLVGTNARKARFGSLSGAEVKLDVITRVYKVYDWPAVEWMDRGKIIHHLDLHAAIWLSRTVGSYRWIHIKWILPF